MDENQKYIQNLKIEDVPWDRITTAYDIAAKIPAYLDDIWNMRNKNTVQEALCYIEENIEHQDTLWHSTPFTMIFLTRIFDYMVPLAAQNKIAKYITSELLDFFIVIAKCYNFYNDIAKSENIQIKSFPLFSDLLDEQYLCPENAESDEIFWEMSNDFPEEFFNSLYSYSFLTLQRYKNIAASSFPSFMEQGITSLQKLL